MRPVPPSHLRSLIAAAALLLATPAPASSQIGTAESLRTYLDAIAPFGFSGAVLVEEEGDVILRHAVGVADDRTGAPVGLETPFLVGSTAKQFTAAAILRLEADGRLSLGDTVGRFLEAPTPLSGVALHELLTHTAGLPYHPPAGFDVPPAQVEASLLGAPVDEGGRGTFLYSNVGYGLLAAVVDVVTEGFEAYVRRAAFEPAGMTRTWFMNERGTHPAGDSIRSYSAGKDEGTLNDFPALPAGRGAGTVVSTVGDLHRWIRALFDGTILPTSAVERMTSSQVQVQPGLGYGYGWNVAQTVRGTTVLAHGGDLGGYNTEIRRYPSENRTILVASNRRPWGSGFRMAVANNLSLLLAGETVPHPPATVPLSPAEAEGLSGTYVLGEGDTLRVRADGEGVRITASSAATADLLQGGPPAQGAPRPMQARFLATKEGGLVMHDPITGRSAELHPVRSGGEVAELAFSAEVRARRVAV